MSAKSKNSTSAWRRLFFSTEIFPRPSRYKRRRRLHARILFPSLCISWLTCLFFFARSHPRLPTRDSQTDRQMDRVRELAAVVEPLTACTLARKSHPTLSEERVFETGLFWGARWAWYLVHSLGNFFIPSSVRVFIGSGVRVCVVACLMRRRRTLGFADSSGRSCTCATYITGRVCFSR